MHPCLVQEQRAQPSMFSKASVIAVALVAFAVGCYISPPAAQTKPAAAAAGSLWDVYFASLSQAKYIDLTHVLKPNTPVWYGFGHPQVFRPAENTATGKPYDFNVDGFGEPVIIQSECCTAATAACSLALPMHGRMRLVLQHVWMIVVDAMLAAQELCAVLDVLSKSALLRSACVEPQCP